MLQHREKDTLYFLRQNTQLVRKDNYHVHQVKAIYRFDN